MSSNFAFENLKIRNFEKGALLVLSSERSCAYSIKVEMNTVVAESNGIGFQTQGHFQSSMSLALYNGVYMTYKLYVIKVHYNGLIVCIYCAYCML